MQIYAAIIRTIISMKQNDQSTDWSKFPVPIFNFNLCIDSRSRRIKIEKNYIVGYTKNMETTIIFCRSKNLSYAVETYFS